MFKPIDITNKKFNKLTAIKFIEKRKKGKGQYHFWEFQCDCGNIKTINKNSVMSNTVKSCGCLHKENVFKKEYGFANFIHTFYYYKANAKKRNYIWDLTKEQFKILTQNNCYYCDAKPSNIMNGKFCNGEFIYNGIDRINNNEHYTLKNSVSCCKICNNAKSILTKEEFLNWIKRVYNYNFKKGNF